MSLPQRIRALRRRRNLTLEALAATVGIHKGHLSRIESGQKAPSLATLEALARALDAEMAELFGEKAADDDVVVVRATEGVGLRESDYAIHALLAASAGRAAALYRIEPGAEFRDQDRPAHGGQEIVYVLEGRVDLKVADRRLELGPGDCATYDGGLPHGLRRLGPERAAVLVIIAG
ncbi:hypothetical protein ASF28_17005 [Methylobacterium sp. Leaf99]|uniref:helix-turn-helix domain-containing protein n=1 Tax=Methylobacterium sp. Leaf99 TaxID=1736251 RepID=UPI0006F1F65F|nr:helix-turn-helix domain-containing protein [Methylobacterium sp. Leaf99]KQP05941.1 hypothetical protein ASF28_17005 [Methylobacterium sp. Leaf99]